MASYLRDTVIVLKKEPFREQDRRYVMYGREHGLLSAVARGASVRTSKQAGHLEPFSESEVMIAKGSAFDKLAVARMIEPGLSSRDKLAAYAVCGAAADAYVHLLRPGVVDEQLFDLLLELIRAVRDLPADPTFLRARFVLDALFLKLLDALGYAPNLADVRRDEPLRQALTAARKLPFRDLIRLTMPADVLGRVSLFIQTAFTHTPMDHDPAASERLLAFIG